MSDGAAQTLIVDLMDLHEALCRKLDRDIERAALGNAEPASGRVTGTGQHDQMDTRVDAVQRAQRERDRQRKNALQQLRDVKVYYEERLGLRPLRRPPVQSIDYQADGQRRVG
jgi:hypothetical protein